MLINLYTRLCHSISEGDVALFGLPVETGRSLWLAIDADKFPALLLPVDKDDLKADITLRTVEILFSRPCDVGTNDSQSHNGYFSLIRLKENNPAIVRLFLKILEELFCTLTPPTKNADIAERIRQAAELFSRQEGEPRNFVGLWGELCLIKNSTNVDEAVRCWSMKRNATYDFVADEFVLDVKSTLDTSPKHRFSLKQLRPTEDFALYIASLCIIEVQNGQTVGELVDTIALKITDQTLRGVFLTQCLAKGGRDLYRNEMALQLYPSNNAIALHNARSIPVPRINEQDPIDNVRFDVDLSGFSPMLGDEREVILAFHG